MVRVTVLLAAILSAAGQPAGYPGASKKDPGPWQLAIRRGVWVDQNRDSREVPWKIYYPMGAKDPLPVVVWSHGLGGSREGGEYLGRSLASHGYVAVHIEHLGSDREALREAMQGAGDALGRAARNPGAAAGRFGDLAFAVSQLDAMQSEGEFSGLLDTASMGISGHSYGAISTLVAAGRRLPGAGQNFAVRRFKAAFAMSPSPPRNSLLSLDEVFGEMLMPIFHLTGTDDRSPFEDFGPAERRIPFDTITNVPQYLLILNGGTHMTFSGRRPSAYPELRRHHDLIRIAAVTFWDAYLKNDAAARAWLTGGGYASLLGDAATFEFKPPR